MESNSVCNSTSDEQNRMTKKQESDLLIMGMIRDKKKDNKKSCYQLIKSMTNFEKETRHS